MSITNQLPVRRLHYTQLQYNHRYSTSHRSILQLEAISKRVTSGGKSFDNNSFSSSAANYRASCRDSETKSCVFTSPSRHSTTSSKFNYARLFSSNGRHCSQRKGFPYITIATRPVSTSSSDASEQKDDATSSLNSPTKTEKDRYYYLIKQKYSPSRHQKYRPRREDGILEKTVSNKPLNQRMIQSYTDIVAYFMPKGEAN